MRLFWLTQKVIRLIDNYQHLSLRKKFRYCLDDLFGIISLIRRINSIENLLKNILALIDVEYAINEMSSFFEVDDGLMDQLTLSYAGSPMYSHHMLPLLILSIIMKHLNNLLKFIVSSYDRIL